MGPESMTAADLYIKDESGNYQKVRPIMDTLTAEYYLVFEGREIAVCTLEPDETEKHGGRVDVVTAHSPFWAFMAAEFLTRTLGCTHKNVPFPKHARCRTRKRFIKLLMGEGIQRRQAGWEAEFTRAANRLVDDPANAYQKGWILHHTARIHISWEKPKDVINA